MKERPSISLTISLFLAMCLLSGLSSPVRALDIVRNGQPVATIVVPDDVNVVAREAAKCLARHIRRGTGAELSVTSESKAAGGGPELERAKALARELELGDAAAFVGPKSHDELKLMYNAADVLAVPSVVARDGETEGMPTVILEAFAAACPVVGSRVAGIPEFVRDGETGFLADAADSGDLAAKIVESLHAGRDRFASSCLAAAAGRDFKKIAQLYAEAAEA